MALPNYLKMFRKRSGLSQREVAGLLGCAYGSKVSRYERGERVPSLRTLFAYEIVFGVPASELYRGIYENVREEVRDRTRSLMRQLDADPFTVANRRKIESLVEVVYRKPPTSKNAA